VALPASRPGLTQRRVRPFARAFAAAMIMLALAVLVEQATRATLQVKRIARRCAPAGWRPIRSRLELCARCNGAHSARRRFCRNRRVARRGAGRARRRVRLLRIRLDGPDPLIEASSARQARGWMVLGPDPP
jgi:hypothetical protein